MRVAPITAAALAVLTFAVLGCGGTKRTGPSSSTSITPAPSTTSRPVNRRRRSARHRPPYPVGLRLIEFVDSSRRVRVNGGPPQPRALRTIVRFPKGVKGPFPLVIFGHGFAVTPRPYAPLLKAWASAGYVVAAPFFPLENGDVAGGPVEDDIVNQPQDMSFLITMLTAPNSPLRGLVNPGRIAVTGQSDGGETALAVAYDRHFVDHRVSAAVVLSGAKIPGIAGYDFPPPSPPLLATQGTADTVNPPHFTHDFFDTAPAPKYLLTMFGAPHLGPYTDQQPQLRIVERVTIAFMDRYLKGDRYALGRMRRAGDVRGVAKLST